MGDTSESIQRLRTAISRRYRLLGWIAGICALAGLVGVVRFETPIVLVTFMSSFQWGSILFLAYLFRHRDKMLSSLEMDPSGEKRLFENYLSGKLRQWDNFVTHRFFLGTLMAGTLLFMIIFTQERRFSQVLASVFIIYVLGLALKNWLDFTEKILLHDYRRIFGHQTSDISEW